MMHKFVYALFIGLATILFGITLTAPVTTHAAEIQVAGLSAADAIIKDENGQVVTNSTSFDKYQDYTVNYNWSIPNGVKVAGNTSTVTVPSGLEPSSDIAFDIKDANGVTVGTFAIKAGSSTGTITYNQAADSASNRTGSLSFHAAGTSDNNNTGSGWTINKIGWISGQDSKGTPTQLTWNVAFNSKSAAIGNATITDTLGPNQTFIPDSVYAATGDYDANGNFIPDGGTIAPTVRVNGSTITFSFTNVNKAVDMYYKTTPQLVNNDGKWTNTATSSNGGTVSATVSWGGSGTGSGSALGTAVLNKTAPDGTKLAGAVYKLVDSTGDVIIPELTTNENGQITINDLNPGTYSLVEVAAPAGYMVNTMPHDFTIVAGDTTPVTVSAVDDKDTDLGGGGSLDQGSVTVTKTGANGVALPGAVFELKDAASTVIKDGLTTDNEGHLYIPGLAAGTYTLVETQAPEGYELNPTPTEFTIPTTGGNQSVTVTDQPTSTAPGTTTPTTPEEPGTTTPEQPGTTTPTEPTTPTNPATPEEPGTTTPTNPVTPEQPGTTEPGTTTPTNPVTPEQPGTTTPTNPAAPEEPGTTVPTTPVTPGEPGTTAPTTPVTPSQPGTTPTAPVAPTTPTVPGTTPETPTTPSEPGTTTPTVPGTTPNTPGMTPSGQGSADNGTGSATAPATSGQGTTTPATTDRLPQTSDQPAPIAVVIGLLMLVGLGGFVWFRKTEK